MTGRPRRCSPDGSTLYVACLTAVVPLDTATDGPGTPIPVRGTPGTVWISPDGHTVYVGDPHSNALTPIDTRSHTAGPPIPAGPWPVDVAFKPGGRTAYVLDWGADPAHSEVTPIDTTTGRPLAPIGLDQSQPHSELLAPDGRTLRGQPVAMALTPDGSNAYAVLRGATDVTSIAVLTGKTSEIRQRGVGFQLTGIVLNGTTGYAVGVTDTGSGIAAPFDTRTNRGGKLVKIRGTPERAAITYARFG